MTQEADGDIMTRWSCPLASLWVAACLEKISLWPMAFLSFIYIYIYRFAMFVLHDIKQSFVCFFGGALGQAFGGGFGWKHELSDSCEVAQKCNILKCGGSFCCAGAAFCEILNFLHCDSGIALPKVAWSVSAS